jgi:hypothetical protein
MSRHNGDNADRRARADALRRRACQLYDRADRQQSQARELHAQAQRLMGQVYTMEGIGTDDAWGSPPPLPLG